MGNLLGARFLAASLCFLWARSRGYAGSVFGGLAVFTGWGALPVTWIATWEKVLPLDDNDGLGLSPNSPALPTENAGLRDWQNYYHGMRQLLLLCPLGAAALVAPVGDCLCLMLPVIFAQTAAEYETHISRDPSVWLTPLWICLWLVGPALLYLAWRRIDRYRVPRIGPLFRRLDRMWVLYALESAGPDWRSCVPPDVLSRLNGQAEPDLAGLELERQRLTIVCEPKAWIPVAIGSLLLAFTSVCATALPSYLWLGNLGG